MCQNKLNELRYKRTTERKNNGLHQPKGQTDGKWNDDSPSSLLLSHSAISFAAPFFGYSSDCISSGQISAFTLHPLLPPPLLRRPTSVQWHGLLHLLEEREGGWSYSRGKAHIGKELAAPAVKVEGQMMKSEGQKTNQKYIYL